MGVPSVLLFEFFVVVGVFYKSYFGSLDIRKGYFTSLIGFGFFESLKVVFISKSSFLFCQDKTFLCILFAILSLSTCLFYLHKNSTILLLLFLVYTIINHCLVL